jgi:uncharacterized membrane protein
MVRMFYFKFTVDRVNHSEMKILENQGKEKKYDKKNLKRVCIKISALLMHIYIGLYVLKYVAYKVATYVNIYQYSTQVESKGFWRMCITLRITVFLYFVHHPEF